MSVKNDYDRFIAEQKEVMKKEKLLLKDEALKLILEYKQAQN